jgi:hypothetical protein
VRGGYNLCCKYPKISQRITRPTRRRYDVVSGSKIAI